MDRFRELHLTPNRLAVAPDIDDVAAVQQPVQKGLLEVAVIGAGGLVGDAFDAFAAPCDQLAEARLGVSNGQASECRSVVQRSGTTSTYIDMPLPRPPIRNFEPRALGRIHRWGDVPEVWTVQLFWASVALARIRDLLLESTGR